MIANAVRKTLQLLGYEINRLNAGLSTEELSILSKVTDFTMTSPQRLVALMDAVNYVVRNRIEGDIVECGVWRGGSMMAAAHSLNALNDRSRHLYLFDTFEGMTAPTGKDAVFSGDSAQDILDKTRKVEGPGIWAYASLGDVQRNLGATGYPPDRIHFVKGDVCETVPKEAPEKIAILRLDTDWYESTRHELLHLYPRLVANGVLIIDDYGHWKGAREAVDKYFENGKMKPLLNRLDYTGRLIVKPQSDE